MRIRTLLVALAVLSVATVPAAAVQTQAQDQTQAQECNISEPADIDPLLEAYNQNTDAIPGFIRNQLAGERVEFRITGETTLAYTVAFDENARAISAQEGTANPSLRVTASAQTLCNAARSQNPIQSLVDAYDSGEITIEGTSPVTKVTVKVLEIGIDVGRALGLF